MSHGFSCRSPTLVLNFSPLSHSEHYTGNTLCQHHFGTSWKKITKKKSPTCPSSPWPSMKHITLLWTIQSYIPGEDDINSNCYSGRRKDNSRTICRTTKKVRDCKRFFDSADGSKITAWLVACNAVEIAATMSTWSCTIAVRTARKNFFPIPRFWTNWLLMCDDTIVKKDSPLRGSLRYEAREITACKAPPHCRSLANWCSPLPVSEVELTLMLWWKVSFVNFIA